MKKPISIEYLKIGMYVCELDLKWWQTDFLVHQFLIKSAEDIQRLRSAGVHHVIVDFSRSEKETQPGYSDEPIVASPKEEKILSEPPDLGPLDSLSMPPFQMVKRFNETKEKIELLIQEGFKAARLGKPLEIAPFKEKIQGMIELISENPSLVTFLMEMEETDDETYRHSVNTMILSLGMALRKSLTPDQVQGWGLAALFHDIGITGVPLHILRKPGSLSQSEWKVIQEHPVIGYKLLKDHPDPVVSGLCATVALEHHERKNGSGYPNALTLDKLIPTTRSIMVLDMYEALSANRVYRMGYSPAKTLEILLKAAEDKIDPSAVFGLVKMIGVYPTGSLIETIRGEIVLVGPYADPMRERSQEVALFVLKDMNGEWLLHPVRRIKASLGPKEVKKTLHPREIGLSEKEIMRLIYPTNKRG